MAEAGEKTFEVLVGGQQQRISVDRLKPHTGPAPVTAAPPARRGRPPKERTAVVAATTRTYAEVVAGGALCKNPPNCVADTSVVFLAAVLRRSNIFASFKLW